jgi:succinate dehydrogenase/fumarate reductase cytochrome b subunit
MHVEINGLLGLILLILDVWAIVRTLSSGVGTGAKVLWVVVILLLPLLGFLVWLLLGPRGGTAAV